MKHLNLNLAALLYRYSKSLSRQNLNEWIQHALITYDLHNKNMILNIGAGGDIARVLLNENLTYRSVDIDEKLTPDIVSSIEKMDTIATQSINAVLCFEVLEHV